MCLKVNSLINQKRSHFIMHYPFKKKLQCILDHKKYTMSEISYVRFLFAKALRGKKRRDNIVRDCRSTERNGPQNEDDNAGR